MGDMNNNIKWILTTLITISLAISGYHFQVSKSLAEAIITNDKDARTRSIIVEEKLVKANQEQSAINTSLLVTLAKIEGKFDGIQQDLNYMKEKINKIK